MKRKTLYCAGHELVAERVEGDEVTGPWWHAKAFDAGQEIVARSGGPTELRALVAVAFELGRLTAGKGRRST